jgi:hypothetical protein
MADQGRHITPALDFIIDRACLAKTLWAKNQPCVRTLNTANHNGWQSGERLDGRDTVQQREADVDNANKTDDEALVLGRTSEADDEDSDGYGGASSKVGGATMGACSR